MIWLYLVSGALALYSVETADINQPLHITLMIALLLCVIPSSIETYHHLGKGSIFNRWSRKNLVSKSED